MIPNSLEIFQSYLDKLLFTFVFILFPWRKWSSILKWILFVLQLSLNIPQSNTFILMFVFCAFPTCLKSISGLGLITCRVNLRKQFLRLTQVQALFHFLRSSETKHKNNTKTKEIKIDKIQNKTKISFFKIFLAKKNNFSELRNQINPTTLLCGK